MLGKILGHGCAALFVSTSSSTSSSSSSSRRSYHTGGSSRRRRGRKGFPSRFFHGFPHSIPAHSIGIKRNLQRIISDSRYWTNQKKPAEEQKKQKKKKKKVKVHWKTT